MTHPSPLDYIVAGIAHHVGTGVPTLQQWTFIRESLASMRDENHPTHYPFAHLTGCHPFYPHSLAPNLTYTGFYPLLS